jgi:hypothetical protein
MQLSIIPKVKMLPCFLVKALVKEHGSMAIPKTRD